MTHEHDTASPPADGDAVGDLLGEVAQGDRDAFARVYDLMSPRVFGVILRVLVDRAQAEEVLQDVFLEVWERAARFEPGRGQGRSWIFMIAHRRAVDRVRSAQASTERDEKIGRRDTAVPYDGVAESAELRIDGRRARDALRELPDPQREALSLAYFGGYSQREISEMLKTPLGTIKTRMRDGMMRLRDEMGVSPA
ncbi:ECF RNA polymerase sigma factor SigK [Microbacterium excoecariae]|uniref:ECF RNA polymerase sigma factor SigK n=1 Tax=Microbacterium excoecariae TaxID=2715210 RepID=UPI00140D4965|nr:ECF RNA polymerase sigma factor SigK [Microbacterium excoecariae]NHI15910.1 sigma-70 family RNA polymerase sigma factor [Microbacterium excoecariae]